MSIPKTPSRTDEKGAHVDRQLPGKKNLRLRVAVRFVVVLLIAVAIVFLPAGRLNYWQGWALLAAYIFPSGGAYLYFLKHDPQLVERRIQGKETVSEQKLLMRWFKPLFFAAFLIPGFDYRFGWSRALLCAVPVWVTLLSLAMVFAGFLGVFWALKVNSYAARTIQVEAGQKIISSGPYSYVRHPLYSGSVVLFLFTPLALGSWVALPVFVLLIPFYVIRLLNEEKVLHEQLPGYTEYCQRTRYRLIPFVW
jgi:protein-S-isoprenylcysteine O-methyltransferase Ste14